MALEWCNGPLVPGTVRLDGQRYKGTCRCGRRATATIDRSGRFAQAHIDHGGDDTAPILVDYPAGYGLTESASA